MRPTTRKRVLIGTAGAGCLGILAFETWRIRKALSGPPQVEEYVNHLDFQLIASVFLVVTTWLPLLGGLLLLELGILSLLGAGSGGRPSAKGVTDGENVANG